jgi:hypothetical protein
MTGVAAARAWAMERPVLALAGAIDAGQVTLVDLERRGRAWLPPVPGTLAAATDPPGEPAARQRRAAIEAAVLGNRLRRSGRLDLAAYTALLLLRTTWCHTLSSGTDAAPTRSPAVLGHSSGAIANALDTLVKLGEAELATEKPRRFRRAATPAAAALAADGADSAKDGAELAGAA